MYVTKTPVYIKLIIASKTCRVFIMILYSICSVHVVPVSGMGTEQNLENETHDMEPTQLSVVGQIYSNVDDRVFTVAPKIIANDAPNENTKATDNLADSSG